MAIGPVQLIVLGFAHPEFHGEVIAELEKLRESDTVRVIDALAVHKDADGNIEVAHLSNLTQEEAIELGSKVGALVGLGIDGEEGAELGAQAGAEAAADGGIEVFNEEEAWDVIDEIPNDSAAALVLIEHHWAVPLRDAIARANGFRIARRIHQPVRPGRDRPAQRRRGRGAARDGDGPDGRQLGANVPETARRKGVDRDVRSPQSRPPHLAPDRPAPLTAKNGNALAGPQSPARARPTNPRGERCSSPTTRSST